MITLAVFSTDQVASRRLDRRLLCYQVRYGVVSREK